MLRDCGNDMSIAGHAIQYLTNESAMYWGMHYFPYTWKQFTYDDGGTELRAPNGVPIEPGDYVICDDSKQFVDVISSSRVTQLVFNDALSRVGIGTTLAQDDLPLKPVSPLLLRANEAINGIKAQQYGSALKSFTTIAKIATQGIQHKLLPGVELAAEDMQWILCYALKGSRAQNGNEIGEYHEDTHMDTAGYAGCAETIHKERMTTEVGK